MTDLASSQYNNNYPKVTRMIYNEFIYIIDYNIFIK